VTITVTDARPSSTSAMFVGLDEAAIPGLGGTFLITPLVLNIPLITDGSGGVQFGGSLPDDPEVSGVQLTLQFWVVDLEGPLGFAGSNGLKFTIE
jgi:hypothetical protein